MAPKLLFHPKKMMKLFKSLMMTESSAMNPIVSRRNQSKTVLDRSLIKLDLNKQCWPGMISSFLVKLRSSPPSSDKMLTEPGRYKEILTTVVKRKIWKDLDKRRLVWLPTQQMWVALSIRCVRLISNWRVSFLLHSDKSSTRAPTIC